MKIKDAEIEDLEYHLKKVVYYEKLCDSYSKFVFLNDINLFVLNFVAMFKLWDNPNSNLKIYSVLACLFTCLMFSVNLKISEIQIAETIKKQNKHLKLLKITEKIFKISALHGILAATIINLFY